MQELNKHIDELRALCDLYNVESLYVFGSASTNTLKHYNPINCNAHRVLCTFINTLVSTPDITRRT